MHGYTRACYILTLTFVFVLLSIGPVWEGYKKTESFDGMPGPLREGTLQANSVNGVEGLPVVLDASEVFVSPPDGSFYRWDVDSDGIWETNWLDNPEFEYIWFDDYQGKVSLALGEKGIMDDVVVDEDPVGWNQISTTFWWAQSFVPTRSRITKIAVDVGINYGEPSPLNVLIRDSLELDGQNLTWGSIPGSKVPRARVIPPHQWPVIDLVDVDLEVGETYYVVLKMEETEHPVGVYEGHGAEDVYPDGILYGGNLVKGWVSTPSRDLRFRTIVSDIQTLDIGEITVSIRNLPPTIEKLEASRSLWAVPVLAIAGEKWHELELILYLNGQAVSAASLTRSPGSPRHMSVEITNQSIDLLDNYSAIVVYTPLNDRTNGQVWGSNPAWLDLVLEDGEVARLQHNFNVRHPETWEWRIDSFFSAAGGMLVEFEGLAIDSGTDDMTFIWNWGDGTSTTTIYYYDPSRIPPDDPYPSPHEPFVGGPTPPLGIQDIQAHTYTATGTYEITLIVMDDDGGEVTVSRVINI